MKSVRLMVCLWVGAVAISVETGRSLPQILKAGLVVKKAKHSGRTPIRLAVIGLGHWGPNYLRTLPQISGARVVWAVDPDPDRRRRLAPLYPDVKFRADHHEALSDPTVSAVVIASPSSTHYRLAGSALNAGKDVLCEKPLALSSDHCRKLIALAQKKKRVLMVAHIFMFNPGVLAVKDYVKSGQMGKLYYLTAQRTNLGPIRDDVNVVLDLATHDVSIFNFILESRPRKVVVAGGAFLKPSREDFVFISLYYPQGVVGHIHASWITPMKQREILAVGSHRMIIWNDIDPLAPVKVYDSGPRQEPFYADYGAFQRMARASDIHLPSISPEEPLLIQNRHFLECVATRKRPLSDGHNALAVLQTLEQIQAALKKPR